MYVECRPTAVDSLELQTGIAQGYYRKPRVAPGNVVVIHR